MAKKTSEEYFNQFLSKIEKHIKSFDYDPGVPFYRGCDKVTHTLTPSLFRNQEKIKYKLNPNYLENHIFYDFCGYGDGIIHSKNDWDILFKMQHHAIPTRLLDWSESLGVALYFALEFSRDPESPCIWVLDPYCLNDEEKNKKKYTTIDYSTLYNPNRDFNFGYYDAFIVGNLKNKDKIFNLPRALYPVKSNERIRSQWGVFTIHGNKEDCISKLLPEAVKQFIIPPEAIPAAKLFLRRTSINHFSLFPDMEGLKRHLDSEYYHP